MSDEHAGIYYNPAARKAFLALPEESSDRLAAFLETQRAALEDYGGGNREGLNAEWEPDRAVYWDIKIRPRPKGLAASPRASAKPRKLGTWYRIEVLEIRTFT